MNNDNNKELVSYLLSRTFSAIKICSDLFSLTTSYWYISGAHYKIQNVSIFSPRSIYQAFQDFYGRIHFYYIQVVFFL